MLRYLTHAVELSATWKLIKPHILDLLTKCVFDLMCFDDEDAELWEDDPQEYIRKVGPSSTMCFVETCSFYGQSPFSSPRRLTGRLCGPHLPPRPAQSIAHPLLCPQVKLSSLHKRAWQDKNGALKKSHLPEAQRIHSFLTAPGQTVLPWPCRGTI